MQVRTFVSLCLFKFKLFIKSNALPGEQIDNSPYLPVHPIHHMSVVGLVLLNLINTMSLDGEQAGTSRLLFKCLVHALGKKAIVCDAIIDFKIDMLKRFHS